MYEACAERKLAALGSGTSVPASVLRFAFLRFPQVISYQTALGFVIIQQWSFQSGIAH